MSILIDPEKSETRSLFEQVVSLAGLRVLEVGAGTGRLTRRYAGGAAHVTALEPDADKVAVAEKTLPAELRERVTFLPVGIEHYDPSPARPTFDAAIMSWSL